MPAGATLPDATTRALAAEVVDLRKQVDQMLRNMRATQLGNSSIEDSALVVRDEFGNIRSVYGKQVDGTFGESAKNSPTPPPRPNTPDCSPIAAGIKINWNGAFIADRPYDFKHIEIHVGASPTFIIGDSTFRGTMSEAGDWVEVPLAYGNTYYVVFVAVNTSDLKSEPSLVGSAMPSMVVAQGVLDGIVTDVGLAAGAVTKAKIAADAVDGTKIEDNSISSQLIVANAIQANHIAAGQIDGTKMTAEAVTAREIKALSIAADKIAANAIQAGHITAGAVTAAKLEADMVLTKRIIIGNATGARVQLHPTSGLELYAANGTTRTGWWDAATGNISLVGQFKTNTGAAGQEYIHILTDGTMRFYQADGRYAQFNNIPGALSMTGPLESSGRQGGIYLAETGVEVNYRNPSGSSIYAQLNVDVSGIDIVGPGNTIRAKEGFGGLGHTTIGVRNSGNGDQPNNILAIGKHQASSTSEGKIWNGPNNIGLTFAAGFAYINDNAAAAMPITASAFNAVPSSIADKTNVKRVRDRQRDSEAPRRSADIVRKARAYEYDYLHELKERPAKPGTKHREPVLDATGQQIVGKNKRPLFKWVDDEWSHEPRPPMKRVGPMVEDMPPEYTVPADPVTGKPGLNVMTVAGLAWDAAADNGDDIDELKARIVQLEELVATLTKPGKKA